MIKINLATRKQSGLSTDAKVSKNALSKFDLEQFRELPVGKVAIAVAACFALNYSVEIYEAGETDKVTAVLAKVNNENAEIQKELNKFKRYDAVKKSLEEDEMKVRTKLETIQKLIADRPAALNVLLSFANTIPKDVWLNALRMDKLDINVKGSSIGFNPISDFMKSLHENASYVSVDLVDTQETKETSDKGVASFELSLKRRQSL